MFGVLLAMTLRVLCTSLTVLLLTAALYSGCATEIAHTPAYHDPRSLDAVELPVHGPVKERVAVLEFRDHADVGARDRDYLTDAVVRGAVREGLPSVQYFVMTRESLVSLLTEREIRLEDVCEGACEVDVGRQIGAHYIVTGAIWKRRAGLDVTVKLFETKSGDLRTQKTVSGRDVDAVVVPLRDSVHAMVSQLAAVGPAALSAPVFVPPVVGVPGPLEAVVTEVPPTAVPTAVSGPAGKREVEVRSGSKAGKAVVSGTHGEVRSVTVAKGKLGIEMVWIPAGSFTMGSPANEPGRFDDEGPQRRVTISRGFWMGKYEVTQGQWEAVMGKNPSHFKNCGANCPVERVSWLDAVAFCNKLSEREGLRPAYRISGSNVTWDRGGNGYRLPTEAEWEYAARAGTDTALYTGPIRIVGQRNAPALDGIAWYGGNSGVRYDGGHDCSGWAEKQYRSRRCGTQPVGGKVANAWGLHDMIGNVWEWCWDWYGAYSSGAVTDPAGPESGSVRVFRGGCWGNVARSCRSANRYRSTPDRRNDGLGIRLCRSGVQ